MAEKLQACRKTLGLKCCPFCGSKMKVLLDFSDGMFANGEYVPGTFCYDIGCSNSECLISLDSCDNFYINVSSVDNFLERFNYRVFAEKIYEIPVEDDTV